MIIPVAPLVLALVLGPMIENNMRRALTISNGEFSIFFTKPLSLVFIIAAAAWLLIPMLLKLKGRTVIVEEEG